MFLEFLNENSGAFAVIFSALVASATIIYAILTRILVSETRKMRQAQTEPKISITIQPKEECISLIDMIIRNIGLGPAYNIKYEINADFEYVKGKLLSELYFIKKGLKYLAPNQKIQFFLTNMAEDFKEKIKKHFEIKVTYINSIGKNYKDNYTIDFSEFLGLSKVGEPPLFTIAKNIVKMKEDIHNLIKGSHKIKAIIYTKSEIEEEKKLLLEKLQRKKEKK